MNTNTSMAESGTHIAIAMTTGLIMSMRTPATTRIPIMITNLTNIITTMIQPQENKIEIVLVGEKERDRFLGVETPHVVVVAFAA